MRAHAILLSSVLVMSGCTLILQPNFDAIAPEMDGGVDAGPDAGDSGMHDGGPDSGPDGGGSCIPDPQGEQCTDSAEVDEDCDGQSNCFDYDCRGVAACCRPGAASTPRCLAGLAQFVRLPADQASDIVFSDTLCSASSRVTEFGPTGRTRALVTQACQPITFGMRMSATFEIVSGCTGTCDFAALSFGPVQTLADGDPFASELRVIVRSDGSAAVERAGTPISTMPLGPGSLLTLEPIEVQVDLEPGPNESGQDVLFATVDLIVDGTGTRVLDRTAVAPLDALECIRPGGGPPGVGLYAAIEGAGTNVEVIGPLSTLERRCSNPSQFYDNEENVDLSSVEACAPGGVGAPALVSYCLDDCGSPAAPVQWDLWVDASDTPRIEESFRFVDFGVCGFGWQSPILPETPSWIVRPSAPFLLGDSPSAREPTLLPISDDGASTRVIDLFYAYAQRVMEGEEEYAIYGDLVRQDLTRAPDPAALLMTADDAGCASVRDPLLVAHYAEATAGHHVDGAWLLFTCEVSGMPDSIRAARFDSDLMLQTGSIRTVLSAVDDTYSERGVFAPEGFAEVDGTTLKIRLWYLARDATGQVRLAYAQGRSTDLDTFPELDPYPANPILAGDSRVLGECTTGCTITGASVTPRVGSESEWQFVISRSRLTATGTLHELVPLLQPAPND